MADQVMTKLETTGKTVPIQRMCPDCAEEEGIQRQTMSEEEYDKDLLTDRQIEEELGEGSSVQRMSVGEPKREEEIQTKPLMRQSNDGGGVATSALTSQLNSSKGGGRPLPESTNRFMSQAFGHDFSQVRVHTGGAAEQMNRGINARAFTHGSDIYFNRGQYNPGASEGKRLLAHELTHVVQQNGRKSASRIQRSSIDATCSGHKANLRAAETKGKEMTRDTIETLKHVKYAMTVPPGPSEIMPSIVQKVENTFSEEVGGLRSGGRGGFTKIEDLIGRYERILAGFGTRNLRCDPETVPSDENECSYRSAFVVKGNNKDIFLCPNFFSEDEKGPDMSAINRGQTLIHELAHSVLNASHKGLPERTFVEAFYSCEASLGLGYDQAIKNAFAYGILANCLHGRGSRVETIEGEAKEEEKSGLSTGAKWALGIGGGLLAAGAIGLGIYYGTK